jgi:hypothetical protein
LEDDEIAQYKKLIKEKGIDEALKIMQSSGKLYNKDFTTAHKKDEAFSDEETEKISCNTQEIPKEIELSSANNLNLVWETVMEEFDVNDKNSEQVVTPLISKMRLSAI